MSKTINDYTAAISINASTDYLLLYQGGVYKKINQSVLLNIAGAPVGTTDSQVLTNKTLTAPTISSPVLSGTVTGTYTIGGTPTFPSAVVTLTGSQTLTNKILTSPTINGGTIDNATVTVDAISGHTSATTVTVANLQIVNGVLNTNSSVVTANLTAGIQVTPKEQNPYKFSVYRSAAWLTGTANQFNKVAFDTKLFDTSSNFDVVTNNRFVAPIAGFYQFSATVKNSGSADYIQIALYKNGAVAKNGVGMINAAGAIQMGLTVSGLIQLAATDYVEVFYFDNGTNQTGLAGAQNTFFDGFLVSAT